jgi:hypothetical protein
MFDRPWIGYPRPSLVECLIVFAVLFFAGSMWTFCARCYVEYRLEENAHA